jgi:GT2 family glycosyltransferase
VRSPPQVSVVVASHNEGLLLRTTVDGFLRTLNGAKEIIVVDDASTDGSTAFLRDGYYGVRLIEAHRRLGAAKSRNVGAREARGETIVFSDAHVEVDPDWYPPLRAALEQPVVGAVGPGIAALLNPEIRGFGHTWKNDWLEWRWLPRRRAAPYPVPFVPAGFLALRRELFHAVGGFDRGLRIWGSIGDELSMRLWLRGYENLVVPDVIVRHFFRARPPYRLEWTVVLHNMMRLALLHFDSVRGRRLFARLSARAAFADALALLNAGDAYRLRRVYQTWNERDVEAFFRNFGIAVLDADVVANAVIRPRERALGRS